MSRGMLGRSWKGLTPERPDERTEISKGAFVGGYVLLILTVLIVSLSGAYFFHIGVRRSIAVLCGITFVLAGVGAPRRLYLILRNVVAFRSIADPRIMRALFLLLGVGLVLGGLFWPESPLFR